MRCQGLSTYYLHNKIGAIHWWAGFQSQTVSSQTLSHNPCPVLVETTIVHIHIKYQPLQYSVMFYVGRPVMSYVWYTE